MSKKTVRYITIGADHNDSLFPHLSTVSDFKSCYHLAPHFVCIPLLADDMRGILKKILKKYLTITKGFVAELIFFVFKISESLLEPTLRLYIYRELCVKFSNFTNESVCHNLSLYPKEEEQLQSQVNVQNVDRI